MQNENLKKLQPAYLKLNQIILTIIILVLSIAICIVEYIASFELWKILLSFTAFWLFYLVIYLYQIAAFKHFSYLMTDYGLYINRGVFWRRKIIVPINRVQHTDVVQGPLERRYNLASLLVHTAGTRNATIRLPGILYQDAEDLRNSLSFEESNDAV